MITKGALVRNGVVENIIVVDTEQEYTPPEDYILVLSGEANIGDLWDGTRFYRRVYLYAIPQQVAVNEAVIIGAVLQEDSPDTTVLFSIDGIQIEAMVQGGKAEISHIFTNPGVYTVTVSSEHHGIASIEVVVQ